MLLSGILAILASAAVEPVKAKPKQSPSNWVQAADLPPIDAQAARTTFDLTIDAKGGPSHCDIIVKSGSDTLDDAVCRAIVKRASFKPAIGTNGLPVYSVRRDRVTWVPDGCCGNRHFDDADIVLTSPQASGEGRLVEVLLSIDDSGAVSSCVATKADSEEALSKLACQVASDPKVALPITDATGTKTAGLRTLFVAIQSGPTFSATIR